MTDPAPAPEFPNAPSGDAIGDAPTDAPADAPTGDRNSKTFNSNSSDPSHSNAADSEGSDSSSSYGSSPSDSSKSEDSDSSDSYGSISSTSTDSSSSNPYGSNPSDSEDSSNSSNSYSSASADSATSDSSSSDASSADASSSDASSSDSSDPSDADTNSSDSHNPLTQFWNASANRWKPRFSIGGAVRAATDWFRVSDDRLAEILAAVRAELPTTEAICLGKPQAGKSSLVRGMTGVSADIVGQGFRPHTRHLKRYTYPSDDLPLLIFTDTVGLGDRDRDPEAATADILDLLSGDRQRARVLVLAVKAGDFATDALLQVARRVRQAHPEIPSLLAVTCLHELYPPDWDDHPPYPPESEAIARALDGQRQTFAGLFDRWVAVDFTLEEDDYHPVFYGLEALRDALADLLPEAEARAIAQAIAGDADARDARDRLGHLYRDATRRAMLPFAIAAATIAAVPLPFATMPVLTALQVSMVGAIAQIYGKTLTPAQAGGLVSAIAGGFLAQAVGRELIKFVPGFGSAIAASWAAAYTWALGEGACVYFGDLAGGKTPRPERIQAAMREAFQTAKVRFGQGERAEG